MEPGDLPQLRPDLEVLPSGEGLLVYDPARRALFELGAADLQALRLLDGRHPLKDIARLVHWRLDELLDLVDDLSDLLLLVDREQGELLVAWRAEHEEADRLLVPILDTCPAEGLSTQPIRVVDDARHSCVRCGSCCHYAVPISAEEKHRLEEYPWPEGIVPEEAGALFQVHPALQWGRLEETIATRSRPTRCAFLDADNCCRVQAELGPVAKPFPCRLFPLAFPVLTAQGILFSLTFECPWIFGSYDTGERLAHRVDDLADLVAALEEVYTLPATIPFSGQDVLALDEYLGWERALLEGPANPATDPLAFLAWLGQQWEEVAVGPSPVPEAADLAGLAETLAQAVRGNRAVVADSPEGEEGWVWAVRVLDSLAARPAAALEALLWTDAAAADLFLGRFVRHFVEGKQVLLYRTVGAGLRALATILLLSRWDAALLEREAGQEALSLAALNRALSRWCRLLDIRPLRLAFLKTTPA